MIPTLFKRSANRFIPALRRAGVGLAVTSYPLASSLVNGPRAQAAVPRAGNNRSVTARNRGAGQHAAVVQG